MKRIISMISILLCIICFSMEANAQWNKDGSPDMRYNSNRELYNMPKRNTDGSPDMRYNSNKSMYGGWSSLYFITNKEQYCIRKRA